MKLIDLLVQELPKCGGWPKGCVEISQDSDGCMCIWKVRGARCGSGYWYHSSGFGLLQYWNGIHAMPISEDCGECIITREQYEAALSTAQQPVWNGEGLPPVDTLCEWCNDNGPDRTWVEAYLRAKIKTESGEVLVIEPRGEHVLEFRGIHSIFRPIRSEADKKRDDAIGHMEREWESVTMVPAVKFEVIYDAIAAGKVPGVKAF